MSSVTRLMIALLFWGCLGCTQNPQLQYEIGDLLVYESFENPYGWNEYVNAAQGVDFRIQDHVFRARAWDGTFTWALNSVRHADIVIEVDVVQNSVGRDSAYGVICRASPTNNGNGYYFLISSNGDYSIRRGAGQAVTPLVQFAGSRAVQQGQAINHLRVACIGDYLSLSVNGALLAETYDSRYHTGYAGIVAGAIDDGEADISFDEYRIWTAYTVRNE